MGRGTWMATSSEARAILRTCPNEDVKIAAIRVIENGRL